MSSTASGCSCTTARPHSRGIFPLLSFLSSSCCAAVTRLLVACIARHYQLSPCCPSSLLPVHCRAVEQLACCLIPGTSFQATAPGCPASQLLHWISTPTAAGCCCCCSAPGLQMSSAFKQETRPSTHTCSGGSIATHTRGIHDVDACAVEGANRVPSAHQSKGSNKKRCM